MLLPPVECLDGMSLPHWFKTPLPKGGKFSLLEESLGKKNVATVCQEARCPNRGECWSAGTATMMILGDVCTRACRFCHVKTGNPKGWVDKKEIEGASAMVSLMDLRYIVLTSVDRDDLEDFGAGHFAAVVKRIAQDHPKTRVEVLVPDFQATPGPMHTLARSAPFVIAQNLETVRRLAPGVRDRRAGHDQTLEALAFYNRHYPDIPTKSSLMLGLGESPQEVEETFDELLGVGVKILTLGQYLRPSQRHLPVCRYYDPGEFEDLKREALGRGFHFVASGPLVRSSYKAHEYLDFLENRASTPPPSPH